MLLLRGLFTIILASLSSSLLKHQAAAWPGTRHFKANSPGDPMDLASDDELDDEDYNASDVIKAAENHIKSAADVRPKDGDGGKTNKSKKKKDKKNKGNKKGKKTGSLYSGQGVKEGGGEVVG